MAYHSKRANREEEEESVFISMTDLMISVLFIIMILMAYFSLRPFSNNNVEMIEKSKYNKVLLELDSAKALLKQREAEIEELLKQIFLLKSRLSIAEGKIKRLEVDVETAIGQSLKYSQRLVIIEKTLTETEEEVREVKDLNEQIIILIKEREALEKENADLKNKLEGKIPSELFDDQKDRLDKLRTYLIVLLKQIEELEKELEKSQMRTMETVLNAIAQDRRNLLANIRNKLDDLDIEVEVYYDSGILRFSEKALKFKSGEYMPDEFGRKVIAKLAQTLESELPCFILGTHTSISPQCNPNNSIVETIQIEGHTDDIPISKRNIQDNLQLSTLRAAQTWRTVTNFKPNLKEFLNASFYKDRNFDIITKAGQPVLSVSGYGEARPIDFRQTDVGRAANRRIDLRFIMMTPKNMKEASAIAKKIKTSIEANFSND